MSIRGLKRWALLLTFWIALQFRPLKGDQTITGNLTVTGTSTLQGDVDVQGDVVTIGISGSSNVGWQMAYTDGTTSSLEFDATRSAQIWKWQQNAGATLQVQMTLNGSNTLALYNSSGTAEITLSPTGTSSFANSITVNGTDNEMPNQTLVNSNSILTEGLADSRYASGTAITTGSATYNGITGPAVSLGGGSATGPYSFAAGFTASASGYGSFAVGTHVYANAAYGGTAIGDYDYADGDYSTAIGVANGASGYATVAMGIENNTSNSFGSVALGGYSDAGADYSVALGYYAQTTGTNSAAIGDHVLAQGKSSFASGYYSTASGAYSTAMGSSTASGTSSTAWGYSTASGAYSTASGYNTTASSYLSYAIGTFNVGGGNANAWVATDPLFEVGNGNGGTSSNGFTPVKSDAFVVYKNGSAAFQGPVTVAPTGDIPMYTGN